MDKWYPASGIAVPCFRNCGTRKLEWRCNLGRILHSKSQQREITLDEATKIIAEEGLDKYKRIEINSNNISDNCAIINPQKDGGYSLIITDEKGNIIREVTALTINNAYYKLVEELRSMGSHY